VKAGRPPVGLTARDELADAGRCLYSVPDHRRRSRADGDPRLGYSAGSVPSLSCSVKCTSVATLNSHCALSPIRIDARAKVPYTGGDTDSPVGGTAAPADTMQYFENAPTTWHS
jgi:hypothetical protein